MEMRAMHRQQVKESWLKYAFGKTGDTIWDDMNHQEDRSILKDELIWLGFPVEEAIRLADGE